MLRGMPNNLRQLLESTRYSEQIESERKNELGLKKGHEPMYTFNENGEKEPIFPPGMVKSTKKQIESLKSPGIYSFWEGDECLYIGRSKQLYLRIPESVAERRLIRTNPGSTLRTCCLDTVGESMAMERRAIRYHKPKLNAESHKRNSPGDFEPNWSDGVQLFSGELQSHELCWVCEGDLCGPSELPVKLCNPVQESNEIPGFCSPCLTQLMRCLQQAGRNGERDRIAELLQITNVKHEVAELI